MIPYTNKEVILTLEITLEELEILKNGGTIESFYKSHDKPTQIKLYCTDYSHNDNQNDSHNDCHNDCHDDSKNEYVNENSYGYKCFRSYACYEDKE